MLKPMRNCSAKNPERQRRVLTLSVMKLLVFTRRLRSGFFGVGVELRV